MQACLFITGSFAMLLGVLALAAATLPWPGVLARKKGQPSTALME
jgi:hypothetical protein